MVVRSILVLILFFASQSFAKIDYPRWHCAVDLELRGDSSSTYEKARDAFVGNKHISCYNYSQNYSFTSENSYELKLVGLLKTGFNSSDLINLRLTQFSYEAPTDFSLSTYDIHVYSEIPFGDKISFYLIAKSLDGQSGTSLLSVMAPVSLANNLRDFFNNDAQFTIRKAQPKTLVKK